MVLHQYLASSPYLLLFKLSGSRLALLSCPNTVLKGFVTRQSLAVLRDREVDRPCTPCAARRRSSAWSRNCDKFLHGRRGELLRERPRRPAHRRIGGPLAETAMLGRDRPATPVP